MDNRNWLIFKLNRAKKCATKRALVHTIKAAARCKATELQSEL